MPSGMPCRPYTEFAAVENCVAKCAARRQTSAQALEAGPSTAIAVAN